MVHTVEEGPAWLQRAWPGRAWLSPPESCFPPSGCVTEKREQGRGKEEGIQKQPDQEQAEPFLAVVPLLKGEPAVNRGEHEAPVDSYNRPLKPWPCVLSLFLYGPPVRQCL